MRLVWSISLVLLASALLSASVPPNEPVVTPAVREEARQYGEFMARFLGEVHRQYVRRLWEPDLYQTAINALYEAARLPLPTHLTDELQAAWVEDWMLARYELYNSFRTEEFIYYARQQPTLEAILGKARAAIGNHDAVRGTRSIMASINALNRVLDPYCGFAGPREFRTQFDSDSYGVGIEFTNAPLPNNIMAPEIPQRRGAMMPLPRGTTWTGLPDTLQVKTVIPGSPAQRAGLRPGDLVTKIDGNLCSATEASRYYRGFYPNSPDTMPGVPAAQPLKLEFHRPGGASTSVVVEANNFDPESIFGARRRLDYTWDFMIDHDAKLGYVRVGQIALLTASDFQEALRSLHDAGAKGVVLDLRWCPGGYLREAIMIASALLPAHSPVARVVYRDPSVRQEEPIPETTPILDLPIVVLINGETSGGGELIAGALQDHGRAIVAGERTVGKASVQKTLDRNPMGLTYKLTIGTFHRPSDRNLQRFAHSTAAEEWGIQPDKGRWLPLSADAAQQLKEQWNNHALRPAGSKEALPTDDPDTDPQLKAALGMLRQKVK